MLLFPACEPIVVRGMEKRKRNVVRVADSAVLTRAVGFGGFCLRLQIEDLEFEWFDRARQHWSLGLSHI